MCVSVCFFLSFFTRNKNKQAYTQTMSLEERSNGGGGGKERERERETDRHVTSSQRGILQCSEHYVLTHSISLYLAQRETDPRDKFVDSLSVGASSIYIPIEYIIWYCIYMKG